MGLIIGNLVDDDLTPDPADLAKLRAVSKAMRDEVDVTGRTLEELTAKYAAGLECLRAVVRLQKRGLLPGRESHYLCGCSERTARRVEGIARPWGTLERSHLLGGCMLRTPPCCAVGSYEWLPMGPSDVLDGGEGRAPRGASVGVGERVPVGRRGYVRSSGAVWAP